MLTCWSSCWSVVTAWVLWRTAFGLRLRSCGENPQAAESLGVNVLPLQVRRRLISGAFAGIGGGVPRAGRLERLRHRPDQRPRLHRPRGDDLRQLAARRHPRRLADVRLHRQPAAAVRRHAVHALLLLVAIGLLALARLARLPQGGTTHGGIVLGVLGVGCSCSGTSLTDEVPREFTGMTPYVATLLVLAFAAQRLRMPKADGQVYRKGSAGWRCCDSRRRLGGAAGGGRRGDGPRLRAVLPVPGRCGGPRRRRPGRRRAATSRTRRTASACAPSAAWCRQLHATGGGRLTARRVRQRRGRGADAVRAVPPAAVRERRPRPAADDRCPGYDGWTRCSRCVRSRRPRLT